MLNRIRIRRIEEALEEKDLKLLNEICVKISEHDESKVIHVFGTNNEVKSSQ